jgi:two-component system, sensor histidine kinase YesM
MSRGRAPAGAPKQRNSSRPPAAAVKLPFGIVPNLRLKLMLYFLAVVLIPLCTVGVMGSMIYAKSLETQTTNHTGRMIGQVTMNIEFSVLEMEKLIDLIAQTRAVTAFFARGTASPPEEADILEDLSVISSSHPEIAGILILSGSDSLVSGDFRRITRDPLTEESWYKKASEYRREVCLFSRPFGRNIRSIQKIGDDEVVSVVKAIPDPRDGSVDGAILVDLKLKTVEDIFKDTSLGKDGFLFIADSEGQVVYAPVNPIIYRVPLHDLAGDSTARVFSIKNTDYQVLAERSAYTGWSTVGVFSLAETLSEITMVRYYTIVIGGITMAMAIVVSIFFTSSIARPVLGLKSLMKRAEEGDLGVRFEGDTGDEIGDLGRGFNTMISKIQALIDQVYSEQQSKREAELRILQEQIKPHFLYNTLDTIQWMAQEHGADDIVSIVGALTSLFRIGLSKGKEMIAVSEELEHVKSYLCIQKARYEDKFDYEIKAEQDLLYFKVLRLILQPLVENAIDHGVKERRGHGNILVEATRRDGDLVIRVCDDGIGMKEADLRTLNESLEEIPAMGDTRGATKLSGYGLLNVQERLRLTFGNKYGLKFTSVYEGGTTVEVRHPLVEQDE